MPNSTRAAVRWTVRGPWKIEDVVLDEPGPGDVLVSMRAAGMCQSDEHALTGDLPLPLIGGHEGSGVVEAIEPGVTSVAPGDHVAISFVPRLPWLPDVRNRPAVPVRRGGQAVRHRDGERRPSRSPLP